MGPREVIVTTEMIRGPKVDRLPVPSVSIAIPFDYPFEMRRAGITGEVDVRISIQVDGHVSEVSIISSSQREFEPTAIAASTKARFFPAVMDGRPIACTADYRFTFDFEH